jgi:MFS family permease
VYHQFGWQNCLYALSLAFILLAGGMFIFIHDKPRTLVAFQPASIKKSLISLLKNAQNGLNCLFIGLLYAPTACFGEQWGASFLSLVQNISIEKAGHQTGVMFIGLAVGCPILGWLSDRMGRRIIIMQVSVALCCIFLTMIIYGHILPIRSWLTSSVYMVLLFMYGFFNSGIVVSYALAAEINPHQQTGIALGVTNMASVILGALMIPIVGLILDNLWTGLIHQGIPIFGMQEYRIAFSALPIGFILAFGISLFQKETFCRKTNE